MNLINTNRSLMNVQPKLILILLFSMKWISSYAQDGTFFIGEKTYPCTKEYYFPSDFGSDCFSFKNLKFFLVRDNLKGMIVFKDNSCISGTTLLYLDDNTIIKLMDKNTRDEVNNICYSVYYFTESEITKLKLTNVRSIRYNISEGYGGSSAYSLDNKEYKCWDSFDKENQQIDRIDFPGIIAKLFD